MEKRTREIIALVMLIALGIAVAGAMAWYILVGHNWNQAATHIDDLVGSMDRYTVVVYDGVVKKPKPLTSSKTKNTEVGKSNSSVPASVAGGESVGSASGSSEQATASSEQNPASSEQAFGSSEKNPASSGQAFGSSEQAPASSEQAPASSESAPVSVESVPASAGQPGEAASESAPSASASSGSDSAAGEESVESAPVSGASSGRSDASAPASDASPPVSGASSGRLDASAPASDASAGRSDASAKQSGASASNAGISVNAPDKKNLDAKSIAKSYREKGAAVVLLPKDAMREFSEPAILYRNGKRIGVFSFKGNYRYHYAEFRAQIRYLQRHSVDFIIAVAKDRKLLRGRLDGVGLLVLLRDARIGDSGEFRGQTFCVDSPYIGETQTVIISPSGVMTSRTIREL